MAKPPNNFDFGNPAGWPEWKQRYTRYHSIQKLNKESDALQIDSLLYIMGDTAEHIFPQLKLTTDEKAKYDKVLTGFDEYFTPKTSKAQSVIAFHTREQKKDESNEEYIRELHRMAAKCEFGDQKDQNIMFRLITGMKDIDLSTELRQKSDAELSLEIVTQRMRAKEAANLENNKTDQLNIDAIRGRRQGNQNNGRFQRQPHQPSYNNHRITNNYRQPTNIQHNRSEDYIDCRKCGKKHARRSCPAYGKVCNKCQKPNHYAKMCTSTSRYQKQVHATATDNYSDPDQSDMFDLGECKFTCDSVDLYNSTWLEHIFINNHKLTVKIDTGAQMNILTESCFRSLCISVPFKEAKCKVTGYTGHVIPILGVVALPFVFRDQTFSSEFYITTTTNTNILGLPTIQQMGLLSVNHVSASSSVNLREFGDVFEGLGKLDMKHHITVDSTVMPIVSSVRSVPIHLRSKLKTELDRLESLGIIEKRSAPSEWVSPVVITPKPQGKIRLCLDPRNLNKAIKREHYKLPTTTEIFSRLAGSNMFSTLDATNGFHCIPLDEESSKLTTFITCFGRYAYLRLPFGLNSSAEVFHKTLSQLFDDIPGVEVYIDDILIHGSNKEIHDDRLHKVLMRCRDINLKLNKEKCVIGKDKVSFLGHEISDKGMQAKRDKTKAVLDMPVPTDKQELQRFLGFVQYLSKFCPGLATETMALREILKKNNSFIWEKAQESAFMKIKSLVSDTPILRHFDPNKHVTLQVDASSYGLGAVLLQDGQPVEYASKSLTDAQKNYAQIEKELLACLFAVKKFHYYIFGGPKFTIHTDHKPLLGLVNKNLDDMNPKLRRMLMELAGYEFELVYKRGTEIVIADTLSRVHYQNVDISVNTTAFDPFTEVLEVIFQTDSAKEKYIQATSNDAELSGLKQFVTQGWPVHKQQCNGIGKLYWKYRNEISVNNNLLFYDDRLIIPLSMRAEVLSKLHKSHQGLRKTKDLAKTTVFWPGFCNDIQNMIQRCEQCRNHPCKPQKQPLLPTGVPEYPFHTIATDLFTTGSKDYLVVVDYYSKWLIVESLTSTTSNALIKVFNRIFADYGSPKFLRSDNGPQYCSEEFRTFLRTQGITQVTSSPAYPQSNGCAERYVQTAKRLVIKCSEQGISYYEGLKSLRNTPINTGLPSPAQLLQGRILPDGIPRSVDAYFPQTYDKHAVKQKLEHLISIAKVNYDKTASHKDRILVNKQMVKVKLADKWVTAEVSKPADEPRSYWLKLNNGQVFRRNLKDIVPFSYADDDESYDSDDDSHWPQSNNTSHTDTNTPSQSSSNTNNSPYRTRSGRRVNRPERWGFDA
jgi:hypothetical protein